MKIKYTARIKQIFREKETGAASIERGQRCLSKNLSCSPDELNRRLVWTWPIALFHP